jgi:hypothetical protein
MQQRQINSVHPSTKFDHSHAVLFHHAHAIICLPGGQIVSAGRHLSTCIICSMLRYLRPRERDGNRRVSRVERAAYPRCSQAFRSCKSQAKLCLAFFQSSLHRPKVHVASVRVTALFYFNPIFASRSTDLRPRVTVVSGRE